jgi:membrane-anchored glycerophosphoryl diester phosphodiesterase (GDPDase)
MHPHPNDNHPNFYNDDHFTLFTVVLMCIICWASVVLLMVLPWCLGLRKKIAKSISDAIDKTKIIGFIYVIFWIIIAASGWITVYYLFF